MVIHKYRRPQLERFRRYIGPTASEAVRTTFNSGDGIVGSRDIVHRRSGEVNFNSPESCDAVSVTDLLHDAISYVVLLSFGQGWWCIQLITLT